jgi:hypothetical protein
VALVGVAQSYDWDVYGFNRLNTFRENDRDAWFAVEDFLQSRPDDPLLLVGVYSMKLVDVDEYPDLINYHAIAPGEWDRQLWPTVAKVAADREVYAITTETQLLDNEIQQRMEQRRYPGPAVAVAGAYRVDRLIPSLLDGVDVWHTHRVLERWTINDAGYLVTYAHTAYFVLTFPVDANMTGAMDTHHVLRIEYLDLGPARITVTGFDSRDPTKTVLVEERELSQSGQWKVLEIPLRQGEYLTGTFYFNRGLTIRSLEAYPLGSR